MTSDANTLNADLHCHSLLSDGELTPSQLARRAKDKGVQLWALTDHDELSGLAEARQACHELDLAFVPGVEISVTWAQRTVHILGLGVDPDNALLNEGLRSIRASRTTRAKQIADKLGELGVPDSYEGALRYVSNPQLISRMHFARFLLDQGYCKTTQDVFNRYLGDSKPGHVQVQWPTLEQAVSWILAATGRAVIAHPGRYMYNATQASAFFDEFKQLGGQGIEVVTSSHRPEQYRKYAEIARQYGFMASRGSDFHTPTESRVDLGSLPKLPAGLTPIWHDWVPALG